MITHKDIVNIYDPEYGRYFYTPEGNKVLAYTYGRGRYNATHDTNYLLHSEAGKFALSYARRRIRWFIIVFLISSLYSLIFLGHHEDVLAAMAMGIMFYFISLHMLYKKYKSNFTQTYGQALIDISTIKGIDF